VLLDIMMPDMDGWEVCRRLRELSDMPIIFLTARADVKDIVKGLEMGADDYIVKPYDNDELVARIRAHLRRVPRNTISEELVFDGGKFRVNFLNREVVVDEEQRHLTPKEFALLCAGAQRGGDHGELVSGAWARIRRRD
jgi:DNA-binding response OmpR family regulator